MKKMTSKDLHVALKNQATEEELMERYGVDSSEELYEVMSKVAPGNFEYFKRRLKRTKRTGYAKMQKRRWLWTIRKKMNRSS